MIMRVAVVAWTTLVLTSAAWGQPAWHEAVGYNQLIDEFGLVADGSGVKVAIVEGPTFETRFMPDATHGEFLGKSIVQGSPGDSTPSSHATFVGISFFGNTGSIAPGTSDITGIHYADFLTIKLGWSTGLDPLPQNFAVSSHAYASAGLTETQAVNLLQRVDYAVEHTGMTTVVALANGSSNPHPQFNTQAYNVIAVGITDGFHSRGTTTIYGAGRTKPDIVAPSATTSVGTGIVSSAATFLHDAANGSKATNPEVIKAILMAGATKSEFSSWSRTVERPLDSVFGAGEMNIYNSYRILRGNESNGTPNEAGAAARKEAWDYNERIAADSPIYYHLDLPNGGSDLSVILTWNIDVIDNDPGEMFDPSTILANMDLRLFDSTGGLVNPPIDSSLSPVDNVEHIYREFLAPGRYTLEVRSDIAHDYGIAWRVSAIPEPLSLPVIAIASTFFFCSRGNRRQPRSGN